MNDFSAEMPDINYPFSYEVELRDRDYDAALGELQLISEDLSEGEVLEVSNDIGSSVVELISGDYYLFQIPVISDEEGTPEETPDWVAKITSCDESGQPLKGDKGVSFTLQKDRTLRTESVESRSEPNEVPFMITIHALRTQYVE